MEGGEDQGSRVLYFEYYHRLLGTQSFLRGREVCKSAMLTSGGKKMYAGREMGELEVDGVYWRYQTKLWIVITNTYTRFTT